MMRMRLLASTLLTTALALATGCDRPSPPPPPRPAPAQNADVAEASAPAAAPAPAAAATDGGAAIATSFETDTEGEMPTSFEPVVGDWTIATAGNAKGLMVDGSKWRNGTPSVNLADQAKRLYGDRYAEFLDGVKTFAFYPLAVAKQPVPSGDMRLRVRFYPLSGTIDQAAGIAFGIAPDGSYSGVRANALEDNLLYFTVVKGKRTVHDTVRGVATSRGSWHTLQVDVRGKHLAVTVDGAKRFEKKLDAVPSGRVGLWSKADSKVLFDDFEASAL